MTTHDRTILFTTRDELLRLRASTIVAFRADCNYTQIIVANGSKYTVCMNLLVMENALAAQLGTDAQRFMRIGKSTIINLDFLQHISVPRRRIILSNGTGQNFAVPLSLEAVKRLKSFCTPSKE